MNTPEKLARDAMPTIRQASGDLLQSVGTAVDSTRERANDAKERAEQSLKRAADVTTRYVSEQPVRSILVAAAVGAAVALLVANNRQRNHNRY